ncbi:hypothetical protein GCM10028805_57390 [Spirosoma harenae]
MPRYIALLISLLFFPFVRIQAQSEPLAIRTLTRIRANQILLRWEPSTESLWTAGIQGGYYVERKVVFRNNALVTGEPFVRLTTLPIRPATGTIWTPYLSPDSVQHQVLYRLVTGQDTVAVQADSNNLVRQESDTDRRFYFGLMAASQSYSAARLAALGYIDATVQANERYVYRVVLATQPAGMSIAYEETTPVGLADYSLLPVLRQPKLTFERYYADLKWVHDTLQSPPYVSYWVERSVDGATFQRVNDRPFVQLDASTTIYTYKDPVPKGRRTYYYRITGKTPFDELNSSTVVIGQSKDTLVFAPQIKSLRLLSDNRVYLSWQFPGDTTLTNSSQAGADSLLKNFFISVAASPSEKPTTVKVNIPPTDTLAYIDNYLGKVPSGSTLYFTVGAVRQDGDSLLSASLFVEPLDTIAPAKPTGLKGRIEANGQVYLSWNPNEEPDLLGYKVFRSQRRGEEPSAVSDTILVRSEFLNSVLLNSLNPTVLYQVKAIDKRYNASALSAPVELLKPDILQPTAPLIISDTLQYGQLALTWSLSSSADVIRQLMLRRETTADSWLTLTTLSATQSTYTDNSIQPAKSYQYLIVAQDRTGLYSDSTHIWRVEVPASQGASHPPLTAFNAQPDGNLPGIRLSWSYNGADVSEFQLYRATGSNALGLWKMVSGLESSVDDMEATTSGTYRYKIQAVFKDGSVSNWQSVSATIGNSNTASPGLSPYVYRTIPAQLVSVGQSFTYSIPDSVFVHPAQSGLTISILPQGLPSGIMASGSSLSGIPLQAGTFIVTAQGVTSDGYRVATTFPLTVSGLPIAITSVPNMTVTIGQSFSYTLPNGIFANGQGQTPQVNLLSTGLPDGVTVTGLTIQGILSSPGPYTVTAQAQNAQAGTSSVSWLLVGNQPPLVQPPLTSWSALVGQVVSWTIPNSTFRDMDGQLADVRIRATGLPPGLVVQGNQLIGVPTLPGSYTLSLIATDDQGSQTENAAAIQILQAVNQSPIVTVSANRVEGLVGDSLSYILPEGLFFDPDGRIAQVTLSGTPPTGMVLSGLTLTGTPTQTGTFTLSATATDDRGMSVSSPIELIIR